MFGLTLEKLVVIAILAGIVVGPQRLSQAARLLGDTIRSLRAFVDATRARASDDLGVPLTRSEWDRLDLKRYDPRRIVREALADPAGPVPGSVGAGTVDVTRGSDTLAATEPPRRDDTAARYPGLDRIRPGQRYLVVGDSAHPRRIRIADLDPDDPRRVRAESVPIPAEPGVDREPALEPASADAGAERTGTAGAAAAADEDARVTSGLTGVAAG